MSLRPPIWTATQPPFTVAQWQELEHQALIFKYLKAGLSVPPDLLAPLRNTLHHHPPSLGYYSYYGKKIDPEPGRCRRTDGKKWRCSREAHGDSRYCERHMIRRRYRSRKPVESSQAAAPAIAPNRPSADGGGSRRGCESGSFQNLMPLHTNGAREGFSFGNNNNKNNNNNNNDSSFQQQLQLEPFPSGVSKKECRFGLNSEADEHDFLQKDLGTARYQGHFTSGGMWSHVFEIPSNSVSESSNGSIVVSNCFQQLTMRDAEPLNIDAARSKQHVASSHLNSAGCLKQEYESPPSLFSDWQWKKDLGSPPIE